MKEYDIPVALKQLITPNQAFHYRVVPLEETTDGTVLLLSDSENIAELADELNIVLPYPCEVVKGDSDKLQSYLTYNYRQSTSSGKLKSDTFLEQLLQTARDYNSSDIHLEVYEHHCRVRFRLDGKLKEQYSTKHLHLNHICHLN